MYELVTLTEIMSFLEQLAPKELAESYDNVGLLVGSTKKDINKVLITLDADEKVSDEAKKLGADLVISHHPLIFNPLKRITDDDSISRTVISFIKNDIPLYAMHTNFDSVKYGLGDLFLDKIAETKNRYAIEGDSENGIGRIADLCTKTTLFELLEKIKNAFNLPNVRYIGENKTIETIAVCNGGGASLVYDAKKMGADLFISGDIKYSQARFAYENDLAFIEIPHYSAEIIFCDFVKGILKEEFGEKIKIFTSDKNIDIWKHFE